MWENQILGAMLLLKTFTARDLQQYTGGKLTTVRDVIKRCKNDGRLVEVGSRPTGQSGRNERLLKLTEDAAAKIAVDLESSFFVIDQALAISRPDSVDLDDRDLQLKAAAELIDNAFSGENLEPPARASLLELADIELLALEGMAMREAGDRYSTWQHAIAVIRARWAEAIKNSIAPSSGRFPPPEIGIPPDVEGLNRHVLDISCRAEQDLEGEIDTTLDAEVYLDVINNG